MIVVVEDLATYQAALDQGKTAPSVMYLILKERQIIFNSELWSKAPEEGGGGGGGSEVDTSVFATKEEVIDDEEVVLALMIDATSRLHTHEGEINKHREEIDSAKKKGEELETGLIEDEETIARILIDIIHAARQELRKLATKTALETINKELQQEALYNEEVTAASLMDLHRSIKDIEAKIKSLENTQL